MIKTARVNWVICPNCKFRYYVGPQLLLVKEIPAVCPKCHQEFDPKKHLESLLDEVSVTSKFF